MGKQSAKMYYQGKYHSDVICETDSLSGISAGIGARKFINNSKMYIGNKLLWERKPANLLAIVDNCICVSNDMVHFSTLQTGIDYAGSKNTLSMYNICTLGKKFVCIGMPKITKEGLNPMVLLKSDDGFRWNVFYEIGEYGKKNIGDGLVKCKYQGEDCIALCVDSEIKIFNSAFSVVKSVSSELQNPMMLGGKTLYLYDKDARGGNVYGIIEEYEDGVLIMRYPVTYRDGFFTSSDREIYVLGEDAIYSVRDYTSGYDIVLKRYRRGTVSTITYRDSILKDNRLYYPDISEESLIFYVYANERNYYFECKDENIFPKLSTDLAYRPIAKRDGIASYLYFDFESGMSRSGFYKGNFFDIDFNNEKLAEFKGLFNFTMHTEANAIHNYGYIE